MKAKYLILIIVCAVVTLSFSVTTHKQVATTKVKQAESKSIVGLASEDSLK